MHNRGGSSSFFGKDGKEGETKSQEFIIIARAVVTSLLLKMGKENMALGGLELSLLHSFLSTIKTRTGAKYNVKKAGAV